MRAEGKLRGPCSLLLATWAVGLLGGCGGTEAPARSPGNDYAPPQPVTSQGDSLGADGVAPEDKLVTGPNIGSEGPKAAATPGEGPRKSRKPAPPGQPAESATPR